MSRMTATLALAAFLLGYGPATAGDHLDACAWLTGRLGAGNVWFGHIAGYKKTGPANVWAGLGCFETEAECRAWLYRSVDGQKTNAPMTCRRGAPGGTLR